ncbi:Protein kinase-like (PK-like) [Apiospora arundinis]|uniref:Protein kinase-like (PK-like) n=1 Tax=Apiospora arundinis TaxID=335852 RepID=A0ABR2JQA2_9PEZI
MSHLQSTIAVNQKLRDHFHRNRENDYDAVRVLLIYWEGAESQDFKTEATELGLLFEQRFCYPVQHYEIPRTHNCHLALDQEINSFLLSLKSPRTLGIIHYGGHGDPDDVDDPRERLSVWASKRERNSPDEAIIKWSMIQPKLEYTTGEVLLILDCCFAAQAMRGPRRIVPPNVELIAACGKNCTTPLPLGPQSFTGVLITEIVTFLDEGSPIIIKELYHRLAGRAANLSPSPVHAPLAKNKSIRLDPLPPHVEQDYQPRNRGAISLHLLVDSPVSPELLDDFVAWLTTDPPRTITAAEVAEIKALASRAEELKYLALPNDNSQRGSVAIAIERNPMARDQVISAWTSFLSTLGSLVRLLGPGTQPQSQSENDAHSEDTKGQIFLREFKRSLNNLQVILERNILTLTELFEEEGLQSELASEVNDASMIMNALRVKLICIMEETPKPTYLTDTGINDVKSTLANPLSVEVSADFGHVLVEYKHLGSQDTATRDSDKRRMERLCTVLEAAQESRFRTPRCLGCIPDELNDRYGLVFQMPTSGFNRPTTLYNILGEHGDPKTRKCLPNLRQRYVIARAIGSALHRWHLVDWVHQGVASYNIVFFTNDQKEPDYSNPYLIGFDYSRERDAYSVVRDRTGAEIYDVYRHPDRQGCPPAKHHTKIHDLYSLGLLMVEICMWKRIDNIFGPRIKHHGVKAIMDAAIGKLGGELSFCMGSDYEMATMLCLSGDFGVTTDDTRGSRLTETFENDVLRRIGRGQDLGADILPFTEAEPRRP